MAEDYSARRKNIERILNELQDKIVAGRARILKAQEGLKKPADVETESSWKAHPAYKVALEELRDAQEEQANTSKSISDAQTARATTNDLEASEKAGKPLSPSEQNTLNILKDRERNEAAGKGYVDSDTLNQRAEAKQTRADQLAAQASERAASREESSLNRTSVENRTDKRLTFDEDQAAVMEAFRNKEISAKEAELKLKAAFDERTIQLQNITAQNKAASDIYSGQITQRQQDIGTREAGQTTAVSTMNAVTSLFQQGGWKGSYSGYLDAVKQAQEKIVYPHGEYNVKMAGPKVTPPQALIDTQEGKMRVAGVGENTGAPPLPGEILTPKKEDTPIEAAVRSDLQVKYDEWNSARNPEVEGPPTLESFREHLKATNTPEDEANSIDPAKIPAFKAPESIPPPVVPLTPPTPEAQASLALPQQPQAFGPQQPQNQAAPANVQNFYMSPQPQTQNPPVQNPAQNDPLQNGEAQSQIDNATSAEVSSILTENEFDPEIISQYQQKHKFNPEMPNPFLQSLMGQA